MYKIWKLCFDCGLEWFDKSTKSDGIECYYKCPNCGGEFDITEKEQLNGE